jgi:hypothetical protein
MARGGKRLREEWLLKEACRQPTGQACESASHVRSTPTSSLITSEISELFFPPSSCCYGRSWAFIIMDISGVICWRNGEWGFLNCIVILLHVKVV